MYMYMVYVIQLEDVTGENDKAYIARLCDKEKDLGDSLTKSEIDQGIQTMTVTMEPQIKRVIYFRTRK